MLDPRTFYVNELTGSVSNHIGDIFKKGDTVFLKDPIDALKKDRLRHLGLDSNFVFLKFVSSVPYRKLNKHAIDVFNIKRPKNNTQFQPFIKGLIDVLYQAIFEMWDDKSLNVIFHSSGYDSRIISWILRDLHNQGKINCTPDSLLFFCHGREAKIFLELMKYEGWSDDFVCPYENDDMRYDIQLDFDNAWRFVNGINCFPVHMRKLTEEMFTRHCKPSKPTRLWYAMYFTEMFDKIMPICQEANGSLLSVFSDRFRKNRFSQLSSSLDGSLVWPVLHEKVLTYLSHNYLSLVHLKEPKVVSRAVCRTLDPKFEKIKRLDPSAYPQRRILNSTDNLTKAQHKYNKSWFGSKYNCEIEFTLRNKTWINWTIASFVEHLLSKGVTVNIAGVNYQ